MAQKRFDEPLRVIDEGTLTKDIDRLNRLTGALSPRPISELSTDAAGVLARQAVLVLDKSTIISALKNELPAPIRTLVSRSCTLASSIVLGELSGGIVSPKYRSIVQATLDEMAKIPHLTPTQNDWKLASSLVATLGRINKIDKVKRREMLADALLYVSARSVQACIVTANTSDYDLLEQALPGGQVLYYAMLDRVAS